MLKEKKRNFSQFMFSFQLKIDLCFSGKLKLFSTYIFPHTFFYGKKFKKTIGGQKYNLADRNPKYHPQLFLVVYW